MENELIGELENEKGEYIHVLRTPTGQVEIRVGGCGDMSGLGFGTFSPYDAQKIAKAINSASMPAVV